MTSDVDICNLALAHLGDEATVTSIDPAEGSIQAEHCQRYYPIARKALLELHPWSFAKKRVSLTALGETAPDSWAYVYGYPNGCVTPLKLLGTGGTDDDDTEDYVVEMIDGTKVIYTSVEDAILVYTALVTDMTKYSALAINALARLLASYLAGPVIKGDAGVKIAAAHLKIYKEGDLPLAVAHDTNARKKQEGNTYQNFKPTTLSARQ